MAAYAYARKPFWQTVAIAAGLTALITFLTWVTMRVLAVPYGGWVVIATGTVFFVFCSWRLIRDYAADDTVLAIQPQGYLDTRWRAEAVPWEAIRRVALRRLENDVSVAIYLWAGDPAEADWVSELTALEADPLGVIEALRRHVDVYLD